MIRRTCAFPGFFYADKGMVKKFKASIIVVVRWETTIILMMGVILRCNYDLNT